MFSRLASVNGVGKILAALAILFFALPGLAQDEVIVTLPPPAINTGGIGSVTTTLITPVPPPTLTALPPVAPSDPATSPLAISPPSLYGISGGGNVELGQRVVLTVSFYGVAEDPTYQWKKGGVALAGATSASYTIAAAAATDAGTYSIVVSNAGGSSATSTDLTVKPAARPVILYSPNSIVRQVGQQAVFSYSATGSYPRTHQWRRNGVDLPGATDPSYTIEAVSTDDAGTYSVVVANSLGSATSATGTLTVNAATPIVLSSGYPQDTTVVEGSSAYLSLYFVSGSEPRTYVWKKNGVPISGAESAQLSFGAAAMSDAGKYSVTVTNPAGSVSSREATLTVTAATPVTIRTHPRDQTIYEGQDASFSVDAQGSYPISYQWKKNGSPISGATSYYYSIYRATRSDAGTYSITITNAAGPVTSNGAVLTVNAAVAPIITQQPLGQTLNYGDTLGLSVNANGTSPFTFQWKKDGVPLSNSNSSSYYIYSTTPANSGVYTVVVTNAAGSVTSNEATITVKSAVGPAITRQPQSQTVAYGSSLELSVQVTGSPQLSFQWKKDGVALQYGTYSSYSVSNATPANGGVYTVVVTNAVGSVTSENATVTVQAAVAPTIVEQPKSQTLPFGSYLSLGVRVEGSPPITYQWKKDGVSLGQNGTSSYLSLWDTTPANSGSYVVVVTNPAGSVASSPAVVTVQPAAAPVITTQPVSKEVASGLSASFSVAVNTTGAGSVTSQWRKNGIAIAGATSTYFTINSVSAADAGDYTFVATGPGGTATSQIAQLVVLPPAPPGMTSWPSEASGSLGQGASFYAYNTPQGSPPFTYQWSQNGVPIAGATSAELRIAKVTENDFASYFTLTISNQAGVITSPPMVLRQPRDGTPTTAWISEGRVGDVAYFLASSPARIERYDLAGERWLATILLGENQVPTAMAATSEGVYLASGRTLVRRSLDLATEVPITNTALPISFLFAFGDYLYYNTTELNGYDTVSYASIRRSTLQAGPTVTPGRFRQVAFAPSLRKGFGSALSSYNAIGSFALAEDGTVSASAATYSSNYLPGTRAFVLPGDQLVADDTGTVFNTKDLSFAGSFGGPFKDIVFLPDNTAVILRWQRLWKAAPGSFIETGTVALPQTAQRLFARGTNIYAFGPPQTSGGLYTVTKVAASDFAGLPTTVISDPPVGRYSIDDAFVGDDAVIHVFSRSLQSLVRWSAGTRGFLPTIALRAAPWTTQHQPGTTRALFTYRDGYITELPLRQAVASERAIGSLNLQARALVDLGDAVVINVQHGQDSGFARMRLDSTGGLSVQPDHSSYVSGLAWLSGSRRLYSRNSIYSSAFICEIMPENGGWPVAATITSKTTLTVPLRFNPQGTLAVAGNGQVVNADFAQAGVLANDILDAAWLPDGLFTLRTLAGETQVQQWARGTYLLARSVTLRGSPVRLFRLSDAQLAVVTNLQGVAAFTILNADLTVSTSPTSRIVIATPPASQSAAVSASTSFSVGQTGASGSATFQWQRNGILVPGASAATLDVPNVQPSSAGLYTAVVADATNSTTSDPAILGLSTTQKVVGDGSEVGANIRHGNGNIYDQVLLQGAAASATADAGQVLRLSCVDMNDDIVQIEFAGHGTLSVVLAGSSAPAPAAKYNQPGVNYVKGHAGIVITGADETTNLSVFSVGRVNAVNQALFRSDVTYDGMADLAFVAILSSNGKFGGLRAANANFFNSTGPIGLYAPGVRFTGPVYLGNIDAFGDATPMLVMESAAEVRITGGDLQQTNSRAVKVKGLLQLKFTEGSTSHGGSLPAQTNRARFERDGTDVTSQITIVNPSP